MLRFDGYSLTKFGEAAPGAPAFLQGPGAIVIAEYVPEPLTIVLLSLGLALFGRWRRK